MEKESKVVLTEETEAIVAAYLDRLHARQEKRLLKQLAEKESREKGIKPQKDKK
jgi:hypothetical protein